MRSKAARHDPKAASPERPALRPGPNLLEPAARAYLEPRFGHSLENVRVFADEAAADLASASSARAVTVGSSVFLGGGLPPGPGRVAVLAHEVAHAVQHQRFGSPSAGSLSEPGDAHEVEAHRAAASVLEGGAASVSTPPAAAVSRWPDWLDAAVDTVSEAASAAFGSDEEVDVAAPVSEPVAPPSSAPAATPAPPAGASAAPQPAATVDQEAMSAAASAIGQAVDGIGTDEDAIHRALQGKSPAEVAAIRAAYQDHYGRSLDADIEDELSDTDLEQARAALSGDPVEAATATLVNAADGVGTNEEAIQQTLRGITDPEQRRQVAEAYERRTGQSLEAMLEDELSDSDLEASQLLAQGDAVGADAVLLDAAMHDTTLGVDWGTDEDRVNQILEGQGVPGLAGVTDPAERQRLIDEHRTRLLAAYGSRTGHALETDLRDEMEGPEADVSLRLAEGDRVGAAAARIALAADGVGTDEDAIFRQLEGRPEAERQQIMAAFNQNYGGEFGSFDAVIADEMGELDAERARQLATNGRLDPVFALRYAQDGIGTDEEMIRGALRGRSATEIADIQRRYSEANDGADLRDELGGELSGRDEHDIMQLMRGEPQTVADRLARARENWDFERGSGAGVFGGLTDVFYSSGETLDRQHERLGGLETRLSEATSPEERAGIEAEINRVLGYQAADVGAYRAAQDAVANNAAMAAAVAAAAAVTVATGGAGGAAAGPLLTALAGQLGVSTTVAAGVLAAGAGGAATMLTKGAILGDAYGAEAVGTDAAMTLAQMASAGVLQGSFFQGAGGQLSGLQNMIGSAGLNPSGVGGMLANAAGRGLTGAAITGTTQGLLDENVWRGPGNGVLRFAQTLGGSALQGVAGEGMGGSLRMGFGNDPASRLGALGRGVAGGLAQSAASPETYSGRWEDIARRFGTSAAQSGATEALQFRPSGGDPVSTASPEGGPAPADPAATSSSPPAGAGPDAPGPVSLLPEGPGVPLLPPGPGEPVGRGPGPTVDPLTGQPVGRFIVDPHGNTMIEPAGGAFVGNPAGTFAETRYPNEAPYQQLHGPHVSHPEPHGHGFLPGGGRNERGPSLDVHGNVVPENSPAAHWPVNQAPPAPGSGGPDPSGPASPPPSLAPGEQATLPWPLLGGAETATSAPRPAEPAAPVSQPSPDPRQLSLSFDGPAPSLVETATPGGRMVSSEVEVPTGRPQGTVERGPSVVVDPSVEGVTHGQNPDFVPPTAPATDIDWNAPHHQVDPATGRTLLDPVTGEPVPMLNPPKIRDRYTGEMVDNPRASEPMTTLDRIRSLEENPLRDTFQNDSNRPGPYQGAEGMMVDVRHPVTGEPVMVPARDPNTGQLIPGGGMVPQREFKPEGTLALTSPESTEFAPRVGPGGAFVDLLFPTAGGAHSYSSGRAGAGEATIRDDSALPLGWAPDPGGTIWPGNPVDEMRVFGVQPSTPHINSVVAPQPEGFSPPGAPGAYVGGGPQTQLPAGQVHRRSVPLGPDGRPQAPGGPPVTYSIPRAGYPSPPPDKITGAPALAPTALEEMRRLLGLD